MSEVSAQSGYRLEWSREFGTDNAPADDQLTDMKTDFFRKRIIVTGSSTTPHTGPDFLTIAYSSSGDELWRSRFDGSGSGSDNPVRILLDGSGNAYVGGYSQNPEYDFDFLVVKYNRNGIEQWRGRFGGEAPGLSGGPQATSDFLTDMVISGDRSVYLTGYSVLRDNRGSHYLTVKFDSTGDLAWSDAYAYPLPGIAQRFNEARAMTIDADGDVYVTGESFGGDSGTYLTYRECLTLKYNPGGSRVWTNITPVSPGSYEQGVDIAAGDAGVYVIGRQNFETPEFMFLQYRSDGTLGARVQPEGTGLLSDLVIDPNGNLYFTGSENSNFEKHSWNYVTFKYDAALKIQWRQIYQGPYSGSDQASRLVVSTEGDVFVTGRSQGSEHPEFTTVKYDTDGNEDWVVRNGRTVVLNRRFPCIYFLRTFGRNAETSVFIGGINENVTGGNDFSVTKLRLSQDLSQASEEWMINHDGIGANAASVASMTTDDEGNVLILGRDFSDGSGAVTDSTNDKIITMKYSQSGDMLWSTLLDQRDAGTSETPIEIISDRSGNVYIGALGVIKYDRNGVEEWSVPAYIPLTGKNLAIDSDNNLIVNSYNAIHKYDNTGNQIWAIDTGGFGFYVDNDDQVYLTRTEIDDMNSSFLSGKYDKDGHEVWSRNLDLGDQDERAGFITVDLSGNVLVLGSVGVPGDTLSGGRDLFTIRYDSSGQQQWTAQFNSSLTDNPAGVDTDDLGNCYVLGITEIKNDTRSILIKYDPDGNEEWAEIYNGWYEMLDVSPSGIISIHGMVGDGFHFPYHLTTLQIDPDGYLLSTVMHPSPTADISAGFSVDGEGNILMAGGSSTIDAGSSHITTVKYSPDSVTAVKPHQSSAAKPFALDQNYPNPFNPVTTITYSLAQPGHIRLEVFNLLGERVAVLVDEWKQAGRYSVEWNARRYSSGVYLYRLESGDFLKIRKLILLK